MSSSSTLFKHLLRNHWANQSNFIWSFYGMGEWKFVRMVPVTWPRWPPCSYMVKEIKEKWSETKIKVFLNQTVWCKFQVTWPIWPPCSYMVKTLKIFFSGTKWPMTLKCGMEHLVLEYYQVCSNDDRRLTLTYFTAVSNLVPCAFV